MPLDATDRSDGLQDFPARFDATWSSYDPTDLAAGNLALTQLGLERVDEVGLLIARQLDYVKARTYTRLLPPMSGDQLVPVVTDTPEGAESITTRIYDEVGLAKVVANYADDIPRVDVRAREVSTRVRTVADSYGYTTQDLRAAAYAGTQLPARKSDAARSAVARKENSIKFKGDPDYGIYGVLTHPNIPLVVAPNGNWASPATTGVMVVDDVDALLDGIIGQSNGYHTATILAMSNKRRSTMWSKRMPDNTTVAGDFLAKKYPDLRVIVAHEMGGTGAGGTDSIFAAEFDVAHYRYESVMPFRALPPQARNLEFVVNCEARTGGVVVEQPLAMARMEGI